MTTPWKPYRFLVGEWTGEGGGEPGKGSGRFSFDWDLQEKVLVRRNRAEYPAAQGRPAFSHEDLMVIYRADRGGPTKAIYFDSEDHVINYAVTFSDDRRTLTFLSDAVPAAPRFRLSYTKDQDDSMRIKFEIAPPGKPGGFKTYLEGNARRQTAPEAGGHKEVIAVAAIPEITKGDLVSLQRRFRILGRPGVPLDHHARKPPERLPFARAGDRTPDDGPARIRLLIHPRGIRGYSGL